MMEILEGSPLRTLSPAINRRRFLRSIGTGFGALALAGCSPRWHTPLANISGNVIDAHCHVFNASDLPVAGFIEAVILEHQEEQALPRMADSEDRSFKYALIELLIRIVQSGAPSATEELKKLASLSEQRSSQVIDDIGDGSEERDRDERLVRSILAAAYEGRGATVLPYLERRSESVRRGRTLLLDRLLEELDETQEAGRAIREGRAGVGDLVRRIFLCEGFVCRNIRWVSTFLRYRYQIANRIQRLYGDREGGVDLFTPALVDFTLWLRDEEPPSSLADQIRVMDMVQRTRGTSRMQCFMAFDPLRQIVDVQRRKRGEMVKTAQELVEKAILQMGFVGVKLYPPMGFRPTDNTEPGLFFPKRVLDRVRALGVKDFPDRLDRTLDQLYRWCVAKGVPVMAHATDSNEAAERYGERADPLFWGKVLEKYPSLQLNMGHFGGFDEGFDDKSRWIGPIEKTWEWQVGKLVKDGRFPNAFADLSYLSELLVDPDGDRADVVREFLPMFIRKFDPDVRSLIYASDWLMLGREPRHREYLTILHDTLRSIGLTEAQLLQFFGGNAARFIGLRRDGDSRRRLESFDRMHGVDPSFWSKFDEAPGV